MLRRVRLATKLNQTSRSAVNLASSFSTARDATNEAELKAARQWLTNFKPDSIPSRLLDISFSRSSGPGGQNVNKVNSKATLKVTLDELSSYLPALVHSKLRDSSFYAPKTNALVIQADENRKQSDNVRSCQLRLYQLIVDAAKDVIPGETSSAQKQHVEKLQSIENARRIRLKKEHSQKKASRRASYDD